MKSKKVKLLSCVRFFVTPWTVACQVPLSMGFHRQEYWNGVPFPSPGNHPNPGIKHSSPEFQADSLPSEPRGKRNCYQTKLGSTCPCSVKSIYWQWVQGAWVQVASVQKAWTPPKAFGDSFLKTQWGRGIVGFMNELWTFSWLLGSEVIGSQNHQPSGFNLS